MTKAPTIPNHPGLIEREIEQCGVSLTCFFEYEPAERGSRENGLQMEPDYPASITLCHAYCGTDDIVELLSENVISEIEDEMLKGGDDDY